MLGVAVILSTAGNPIYAAETVEETPPSTTSEIADETVELQIQGNRNTQETSAGTSTMTMVYFAVRKNLVQGVRVGGSYQAIEYDYAGDKTKMNTLGLDARIPLEIDLSIDKSLKPEPFADGRYYQMNMNFGGESYTDSSYGAYGGVHMTISRFSTLAPGAGILLEKYDSKWQRDDTQSLVLFAEYKYFPQPENGKLSIDVDFTRKSNSEVTEMDIRAGLTIRF